MGSVTFTIRPPAEILQNKGIAARGKVQKCIDRAVLRYSEPFVPKDSGRLIASGNSATKIGSGTICYDAPYAKYQYYGVSRTGKSLQYHGGGKRGSYWFARMKAVYLSKILAEAAAVADGYPDINIFHAVAGPLQGSNLVQAQFNFIPQYTKTQKPSAAKGYQRFRSPQIRF